MLGAFFDDSGTHDGSPVVAMGGLLGTDEQWNEFARQWTALLAKPLPEKPPLKQFHLTDCRNGYGEFADYKEADRNLITRLFREIILNTEMVTFAAVVDGAAWDELIRNVVAEAPSALELCFMKCVDSILEIVRRDRELVLIYFDSGIRARIEQWVRMIRALPDKYPEVAAIGFRPVPTNVGLQGADMIATESFHWGLEYLKHGEQATPNPHFRDFRFRERSRGLIFLREHIAEMAERMRTGPPPGGAGYPQPAG